MSIETIKKVVGDTPHMTLDQATRITQFIGETGASHILELGFRHGVSTCYLADALAQRSAGSIVTIDLESARSARPNIEELLDKVGHQERVQVYYEPTSYTWRLMKLLEQIPIPQFDLCYIDGAHSWFVDALAFFLVDRLLRPGGWIIFDDLDWTYASSPALKDTELVKHMPADERTMPQVRKIYELLVKHHPFYHDFRTELGWAFAHKKLSTDTDTPNGRLIVTEQIIHVERIHVGLGALLIRCVNKFKRGKTAV
jgi:predicted O-methyltransferase YrrM